MIARSGSLRGYVRAAVAVACCLAVAGTCWRLLLRAPPSAPVRRQKDFTDISASSGVNFRFDVRPRSIRQTVAPGAAIWDYDGDGWPDLWLVGQTGATASGGGKLFHNRGDGTFEDATAGSGLGVPGPWMGCAVGDVDDDGRPDLLLTGFGDCRLFRNLGSGRFKDITRGSGLAARSPDAWATSAGFADVNGDGRVDLVIGRYVVYKPIKDTIKWWSPSNYEAQRPGLYLNLGNGRFRDATAQFGLGDATGKTLGLAFADLDGDGYPDLYLANDEVPCDLYVNRAGSRFVNWGVASGTAYNFSGRAQAGMGVDWGDYNGDGRLDLVVTTFEHEPFSLYQNEGDRYFSHVSFRTGFAQPTMPYIGWGVKFLDYDDDGVLDLFCANGHVRADARETGADQPYEQPLLLFHGNASGHFDMASGPGHVDLGPPMAARGVAVGDVNNDGYPDILVASMSGAPRLFRNDNPHANRWIGFHLLGRKVNRMAIGARVAVSANGRRQIREVTTGGSYLSASDPRLLFGLGTAARVDSVDITWPGGARQHITDAQPGRYHTYVEPEVGAPRS
jgi:hypothetical protein